ncbi:MAG TPA: hypothetical protein VIH90_04900 [Candidatus Saccharimonadales bacterium]
MTTASIPPLRLETFGIQLGGRSVAFYEEPLKLRAGGESHWYVDVRTGLDNGISMSQAGKFIVEAARTRQLAYKVVSAIGVGGHAVMAATIPHLDKGTTISFAVDKHEMDEQGMDQYGLHADIENKRVWVLDDTATTGDSLFTLIDMVRACGGIVEDADVAVDRSGGVVSEAMRGAGVKFHALFEFSEETGLLVPASSI